jgi:outer membrane protein OmpA-like peptidoglycan-associated protein
MIPFRRSRSTPATPSRALARAEHEADHVAGAVLDRDNRGSRDSSAGHLPHAEVPQTGAGAVPGVGVPLDPARRAFFERRLGADLSSVRVHSGAAADRAAQDEHAHAYTFGEHVVLGDDAGQATLAHELVHVLQQRGAGRNAVQRQEKTRTGGIGRTPPTVDYDVVEQRPPGEDARVLFPHDSVSFSVADVASLLERLPTNRTLDIDIDGYASTEGDTEYNVNLSAHRAVVLQQILRRLVPGATVRVHAHGATAAFGDPAANRRVGIRFAEAQVQLVPPLVTPGPGSGRQRDRHPGLLSDAHLHLDPGLTSLAPPGTLPPTLDTVPKGPAESQGPPQLFPPRVPELPPAGPVGPAQLFPWTVPLSRPVVDQGDLHQVFTDHGIGGPIDLDTARAIEEHATLWFQFFRERGLKEDDARSLANLSARSMVNRELTNLGNTLIDRSNNDLVRQGQSVFLTPTLDLLKSPDYYRAVRKFLKGL